MIGFTYSQLETLHDEVIVWLVVILLVAGLTALSVLTSSKGNLVADSEVLEQTWTIIPIIILVTIAYPRLHLLCVQDSMCQIPNITIKVIGNQWNWQRETETEVNDHLLDPDEVDNLGSFEVPIIIVRGVSRIIVARTDVLHSLGLPRLGLKLDAVPGRLNMTTVETSAPGLFVGSCFELCGRGHSAMPINVLSL